MSDNLERFEGKTSFAYNKDVGIPWHRTGQPMSGFQTVDTMLTAAFADYDVEVVPVYVQAPDGTYVELESKKATARTNPHTGAYQPLAAVGNRYTPVQNREVLERALAVVGASKGDAVIDTLGVLDEGPAPGRGQARLRQRQPLRATPPKEPAMSEVSSSTTLTRLTFTHNCTSLTL